MSWLDINCIAFELWGYPLSYLELIGTAFGLLSVYLASRGKIWTWPAGIVNEAALFWLFYQVQLYSDMYLQVYFFIVTLYGWYFWHKKSGENTVQMLSHRSRWIYGISILLGTLLSGYWISKIHLLWPSVFSEPAAYPFIDAFTTVTSIVATILLSRKRIETWLLWIIVDVVSVGLYVTKGIQFLAAEYVVFLLLCVSGYLNWRKKR